MEVRGGNRIKWGQRTRSSPRPCMVFFVLPHSCLTCMIEKIFLPYSCPLGPCEALDPPCKTLLFVNFPYNYYNFFNKICFINENILDITTKFILSNQTIFLQKLNKIIQMFNKTISEKKSH